jgi:Zn-dependent protease
MTTTATDWAVRCAGCGTEVSRSQLSCPGCHRLIHATTLKELAGRAEAAAAAGELTEALGAWRSSLDLLPPGSRQHALVSERVAALSAQVEATPAGVPPPPDSGKWKWLAALGPIGLLLWKFKFIVVAVLSKGKLLLLGLTKMSTLASMFATVGLYWTLYGLWYAVGLVVSIYVHEMGHVAALRRYGIRASAPMFIPGLGALVRLKQAPIGPREDARIGLAGPLWGLGAAIAAGLIGAAGGGKIWLAIAHTGAWINLFNLMPIWQLDGGRAFASLTRAHRWYAAGALAIAWWITGDGLVFLVLLVAIGRAVMKGDDVAPDAGALVYFALVAIALATVFYATGSIQPTTATLGP